jgi:ABC-type transporter Mla MlaB component
MTAPSSRDPHTRLPWIPGSDFSEWVDRDGAAVRCTGHLTEQSVDLVLGAVEVLRREGHERVTVDLHAVESVDEAAVAALRDVLPFDCNTTTVVFCVR